MDAAILPRDLQSRLELDMRQGERGLWLGQPIPRSFRAAWPLVIFGIVWTAFAIFWVGAAAFMVWRNPKAAGPFIVFPLFGLPFVLLGIGMIGSPYRDRRKAARTLYAVTNERVVVIRPAWGKLTVRSFEQDSLQNIEVKESDNGAGDILLGPKPGSAKRDRLDRVPEVRRVEELLRTLARTPRP